VPDGFDPKRELQRILTLQELMTECRVRAPKVLELADDMLDDPTVSPETRLRVMEFLINRGYGKPRQHVILNNPDGQPTQHINPVKVYIPDNRRETSGPLIDYSVEGQE